MSRDPAKAARAKQDGSIGLCGGLEGGKKEG